MTNITTLRKKLLLGVILSLLIASGGLFSFPKKALGANDYVDNVSFYGSSSGATSGYAVVSFHIKTTFIVNTYEVGCTTNSCKEGLISSNVGGSLSLGSVCYPEGFTFTAGNTYTFPLTNDYYSGSCGNHWCYRYDNNWDWVLSSSLVSTDYISNLFGYDIGTIYFTEYPNLVITYPLDNAEIAGAFNITGSYSIPEGAGYNALIAFFYPPNWSNEGDYVNAFYQELSTTTGSVLMPVYSLALGNYQIVFRFYGQTYEPPATLRYEVPAKINISILEDIPPILSPNEPTSTPPIIPQYLEPSSFYPTHSNYPSSTPLYNSFTSALNPLLAMVSNNLTAFNDRFSLSNASSSGSQFGGAILVMRGYADNLNSLFGNAPISQAFSLYVILFLAVIIFRLIRSLINTIKLL